MKQTFYKLFNFFNHIKCKADAKLDFLFLKNKQKILNSSIIKKIRLILTNFDSKYEEFFNTNFLWKTLEPYYRKFEKKFHSIMDDLEQDLENQKKQIFAQNSQEFRSFISLALFYLFIGFIVWIFIILFKYNKILLYSDDSFMPLFHTIRFPKSHVIRFVQFPKQLVDFNFRYYNPIKYVFKFDLTPKLEPLRVVERFTDYCFRYPKKLRFVLKILPKNW